MGKMRKLAILLLMLIVSISLLGCGGSEVSSGKVYFLLHNDAGGGFNEDLKQALLKKAQEGGVAIEVLDGKGDSNLQLDQMNESGCDVCVAKRLIFF